MATRLVTLLVALVAAMTSTGVNALGSPVAPTWCSNGVFGVESANGEVCCVAECGSCGGAGCSEFNADLGADDCCVIEILRDGESCSAWGEAPCYIEHDAPAPSPTPEMMPTPEEDLSYSYSYSYSY